MADPSRKVAGNHPGRFYVDETCIDCDLCRETAPANFVRDDHGRYSFIERQPEGPDEHTACLAAMAECPVEAIGIEST